jgi:hypothetical protein
MSTRCFIAALAAISLAGCAATTAPGYDSRFGDSARQLKAQQLLDPRAPTRNAQTTPPTDGRTLREAAERHVDTYRAPPPSNVINIGVGGGGSR